MAQEDRTNYSFLLKCLAAVTAAALFIAGIIAAASLNAGTTGSFMLASSSAFAPIIPIALTCIGLVCLLAYLCSDNNNTNTTVHMGGTRPYGGAFFSNGYSPAYRNYYSGGTTYVSGARPNSASLNMHGHSVSSNTHSHFPASNTHGHSVSSNTHSHFPALNTHGHAVSSHMPSHSAASHMHGH
ncbi:MAG: hypothetical protein P4L65_10825 [Legionella sp.]|nr:hypothetical protein [Legionella sp.]